ncbi:hypothetical protein GIB67_040601 [Kingdonia uniflora]|uniref:SWIM-type domain-containing protein n=1 Tax=Kingdonia uniflora TaxID=39325 RepID=A0A7J7M9A2_9MAGN|nr:hypothetical protein GIB67_040601 [Kingdonia uniflora]
MSEMNAAFQPGVVSDVMTLYLGNKFLVRNDTDLLKMWKMSDVESLWDVHFYKEQNDEVSCGIVDPIDLDVIPEVILIDSDDDASIEEIATQVKPIVEPIVYNIQAQRPKKLVTKASDDEVIVENTDVGGNTVGEGVDDMGGNTVDGDHRGGVGDMGVNTDNWSELDPDNLNAEEGYYSTHTFQDGDDGPTQENIDRCDLEFRDLAKEYDNIFAEEEDAIHSVPPQPTYGELRVGMEWATVVRLFCIDENCEWMFYARRTANGHIFTLRKSSNLKHTCSSGTKNRLANATWVAKKVESMIRSVRTTTPVGLVLVPRAQTHIDKLKRQYGQYRIEGTKKGDGNTGQGITGQYVAIAVSGQRWRVNLGTHEYNCHEWQVTGLLCVHAVSVIVPYRYSWANFVSEYHKVSSYAKTYKDAIYPVVDSSEWGQPQSPYFLPPPLVRGPGRPKKERIHDPDKKRPHKGCGTCGCFGHNKTTCKGGERDAGRTGSGGRTGRNTVGGRTSARGGGGRGGARGEGRTGRNAVGGRTGGENAGGKAGIRGGGARGGARGRAKQTFQASRQSEGVTQVSTSQAPRHSQGDTQVSQSQVRALRQPQNQQSQAQASSSNPYKKEFFLT